MIRSLISTCLSRRPLVLIAFAAFLAIGFGAFRAMNIEAYPDPAPPIIEIIAQYPGQSPEEVERYVTIPTPAISLMLRFPSDFTAQSRAASARVRSRARHRSEL